MSKEILEKNKGITLVGLVLTIIVLLILAGVSLSLVVGETGIVERATKTKSVTETAELQEKIKIAAMAAQIDGLGTIQSIDILRSELDSAIGTEEYTIENIGNGWNVKVNNKMFSIDENAKVEEIDFFDAEEWNKTAADEDCFYWASDDPTSEEYGMAIGFKEIISNYTILRFPSRLEKFMYIHWKNDENLYQQNMLSRTYSQNIKKVEVPETTISIELSNDYSEFSSVEEINWTNNVLFPCNLWSLKKLKIEKSVDEISSYVLESFDNLEEINVDKGNKNYSSQDGVLYDKSKKQL